MVQQFGSMDLLFESIEQPAIQDAGVLLFRSNNDGVGILDARQVVTVARNDTPADASLEDFLEFFTLLGIRPQYENRVRHY